ncbi:MAG: hypothetical protein A3B99_05525 [Candidatus Yanofskybacteria bacterium RIFCSPHIGHO2_02_FULL_44_12b]|uniref:Uncharacterized protein n=1 Tax=Candidatus Yanofskybacteria bacterium GW2011_GWA2_44_9 TaxID=1619025 RepID=A0A0G1KAM3_9BACT|nr:MAG: hypothetical protein UW79_C0034G0002 [Candidatus Yanofskybacteria bacterium GW2011_GWA2_44_9]OGN04931.1 MAG: hypothetical protein A2659_00010 [Candidatus Yanofskybacteria bacterium RIFCSPHIGHO2_01_FULL_44_24]OGN16151.1 MAG: hypothetical protein A3B99_05525 [Candidatus Yanofskybacteria bacterium RIFCSPHIGHO2_02_FULL_44_12b]
MQAVHGEREVLDLSTAAIECVEPGAPWVKCCVCKVSIKTCSRKVPANANTAMPDYTCPAHPQGAELSNGTWICSAECWDFAIEALQTAAQ